MTSSERFRPYLIWACAALFYMYQFVLRVSPSVMLDDLMIYFQINASEVALLSALALYSYALLQLPAGILADLYGIRRVILGSIVLCILGVLLFISTPNLLVAKAGRILLGAGSAAAFLCVSKISSEWFPAGRHATLLGMTMAAGTVGALNGGAPLSYSISFMGWRESLLGVAALGLVVFALCLLVLRNKRQAGASGKLFFLNDYGNQMRETLSTRVCWFNAFTALGVYLSISVIADLWGISYLMQTYGFTKQISAQLISLIYVGLCVGSLSLTFISDYLGQRKGLIILSLVLLVGLNSLLIYYTHFTSAQLAVCLFLIGFFSGAEMLCFASACENSNKNLSGTVTGFINCVVMLGGAIIQEQIGNLLDKNWGGQIGPEGLRVYLTDDYQRAMGVIVAVIAASALTSLFLPEKRIKETKAALA